MLQSINQNYILPSVISGRRFSDNSSLIKKTHWTLPGDPVVKNPPASAGDMSLISGWGTKIPHAWSNQSPCATTTEPCVPLLAATRESLNTATKTQRTQK